MALTPKDPVFTAVPYLQCSEDDVDGDEFESIAPTPKDPVSMPTPKDPVSMPTPKDPVSMPTPKDPVSMPTPKDPVSMPTPKDPVSMPTPKDPVSMPTPKDPVSMPTPKDPVSMPTPKDPVSMPTPKDPVSMPTPKDPVSMPTPSLECSEDVVEEEEENTEKYWSEEMQEQFENWFREYPFRPKGIDTCCFGEKIVEGMTLMEIFYVRVICHAKSRRKLNLNGRITVHGAYGESEIFARTRERPEKLYPQERLTLTGPQFGILGYGLVDIRLNLKHDNHQVCEREEAWCSSACGFGFKFDHMRTVKIKGKKGFNFHMKFAVFENANLITVDIELPKVINNGENDLVKIVEAYIETSECRLLKTTLFNSKRDDGQVNSNGGKLPLSKSLLACPVGGALLLDLFFPDHSNSFGTTKKSVKFVPTHFGREEMVVESEYGSVVVGFTAYPVEVHPATLASAKIHYWRLKWPKLWENHW